MTRGGDVSRDQDGSARPEEESELLQGWEWLRDTNIPARAGWHQRDGWAGSGCWQAAQKWEWQVFLEFCMLYKNSSSQPQQTEADKIGVLSGKLPIIPDCCDRLVIHTRLSGVLERAPSPNALQSQFGNEAHLERTLACPSPAP